MPRVKRAVHSHKKRRAILKLAKGFRGGHGNLLRSAKEAVARALRYAYRDRRNNKREFRALWIVRVNAAARENGLTYGQFMAGLKAAGNTLDRKSLSELAVSSPAAFASLAKMAAKAKPVVAKKPLTTADKVARPKARAAAEAKA